MSDKILMALSTLKDILSHHYFYLDAETIFGICDNNLEMLLDSTKNMILKLSVYP